MKEIKDITEAILKFRDEREWAQFHNAKDLAIAISIEANELLETFLWKEPDEGSIQKIKEELADVMMFSILLAHEKEIDIKEIILQKIEKNKLKYPVEKSKGSAKKYDEL